MEHSNLSAGQSAGENSRRELFDGVGLAELGGLLEHVRWNPLGEGDRSRTVGSARRVPRAPTRAHPVRSCPQGERGSANIGGGRAPASPSRDGAGPRPSMPSPRSTRERSHRVEDAPTSSRGSSRRPLARRGPPADLERAAIPRRLHAVTRWAGSYALADESGRCGSSNLVVWVRRVSRRRSPPYWTM